MLQSRHQLVKRLVEFLDSFILKLPRHIVDADSQFRQSLQHPVSFLDILFEPGFRLSVIAVLINCFQQGRVDGVRSDKGLSCLKLKTWQPCGLTPDITCLIAPSMA